MPELVMVTTADTDIHVIEGNIDLVCMKLTRNEWIATTDGRRLRCNKVVSVWVPSEEELQGFLESMEEE